MSKLLAVSWTPDLLRYVHVHADKEGAMRIIDVGEKELLGNLKHEPTATDDSDEETKPVLSIADHLKNLVSELGAGKSTLLLCVSRGIVDSVTFAVPPASEAELPTLVRNIAIRQLTGVTEESPLDFIAYAPREDGSRDVCAMVLPAEQQQTIQKIVAATGCPLHRVLITTHSLRTFVPAQSDDENSASFIVSEGDDAVHLLIVQNQQPVTSRTVRLSTEMDVSQRTQFIANEIQRTLLSAEVEVGNAVLVGSEVETARLIELLRDQHSFEIQQVSSESLIDGDASGAAFGIYTPLVAALKEEALGVSSAIDFAHPKRPPDSVNNRNRILGIAAAILLVVVVGWYYVNSQFSAIQSEIDKLKIRRSELNELVKKTSKKRNLSKVLQRWEMSRMSWLDELRDLTIRIPSSPELSLQQFSASSTKRGAIVSFRGTSKSPQAIRKMEINLGDKYHQLKTPGIRERKQGNKSIWTFQTTMTIRSRDRKAYTSHLSADQISKQTKGQSSPKITSSKTEVKKKTAGEEK